MSRGLGKVQTAIIRLIGGYPITGATYRHIRIQTGLSAQTLSRALRRLTEMEYIIKERVWWGDDDDPSNYVSTSKGLAAYAAIHTT